MCERLMSHLDIDLKPRDATEQRCDFCNASDVPLWAYPAKDFDIALMAKPSGDTAGLHSTSYWCACDDCHDLIQREDMDGLLARNTHQIMDMPVAHRPILEHALRSLHMLFMEHRDGEPERRLVPQGDT